MYTAAWRVRQASATLTVLEHELGLAASRAAAGALQTGRQARRDPAHDACRPAIDW